MKKIRDDLIKKWRLKHHYWLYYSSDGHFLEKDNKRIYIKNLKCSLYFEEKNIEPNELDKCIAEFKKEMQEVENDAKDLKAYLGE